MIVYTVDLVHMPAGITALALGDIPLAVCVAALGRSPTFATALVKTRDRSGCAGKAQTLFSAISPVPEATIAFVYLYSALAAWLDQLGVTLTLAGANFAVFGFFPSASLSTCPLLANAGRRATSTALWTAVTAPIHHVTRLTLTWIFAMPR